MKSAMASDIAAVHAGRGLLSLPRQRERGFTLIELVITVTIAAVLLVIAVPSFRNITLSSKLTTISNEVVGAINTARMEAIRRNAPTQLCSNSASANTADTLGAACDVTAVGAVYVLAGATAEPVRAEVAGLAAPIELTGDVTALRFTGQGLARKAGSSELYAGVVADICTSALSTDNHRVIEMVAGGSVITTTKTTASCP